MLCRTSKTNRQNYEKKIPLASSAAKLAHFDADARTLDKFLVVARNVGWQGPYIPRVVVVS